MFVINVWKKKGKRDFIICFFICLYYIIKMWKKVRKMVNIGIFMKDKSVVMYIMVLYGVEYYFWNGIL